jgi:FkbM family methyltransferase
MNRRVFVLTFLAIEYEICESFDIKSTCGDGYCVSPEFETSCVYDCGEVLRNPELVRRASNETFGWDVRPAHLKLEFDQRHTQHIRVVEGMVLNQEDIVIRSSTSYWVQIEASASDCVQVFLHTATQVLWAGPPNGIWESGQAERVIGLTARGLCETNISRISMRPVPITSNFGWKYYDIVDSILVDPVRISPAACRERCLSDGRCCAWQVCPGTEAEGCGGCYILGRRPRDSSGEKKIGWFGAIERAEPVLPLGVDDCRLFLLSQSAHEKDFYDMASGKLQKYVSCANIVRADKTVPKQIFVGGVHIPTTLVANHRNPDPRLNPGGAMLLPHFYILPFYDTNIGNIMKHTTAMNIVQSYEMQSMLRPGEVFVDAGANLGSYTLSLAEHLGASGIVIAFEPFRWLFQILNANIAANGLMNCWTYQAALGHVADHQSLLQPNLRFFSSPGGVRVDNQLLNMSAETQKQMYDIEWGPETVDVVRLDDIIFNSTIFANRNRTTQVDLIKIDVEGMELSVLRGSFLVLQQLKPIVWVENVAFFESGDRTLLSFIEASLDYVCWKSLSAGNDLICEPKDGSRSDRLHRVRKTSIDSTEKPPT